ncbi:hypothetical protein RHSIM_Rhsim05G0136300 [Rhododendron simsii]|uniref:DUF4283 domain-containing protein n=1 Tax=Rhododendron simsii TaxID=118357 RepID=A0A834H1Z9_RHOSS|nr:hypothetical protein RHSIM_Rhsim05G0136300 [Rhododendron simsii]
MSSSVPSNTFDTLFPPLGLSSSTSASKLGFAGFRKPVLMLSNNSLHCGTIPLLVTGSGPDNDNQGNSSSVGRVNLLDFLEFVPVTNNDLLEIKEDDTSTVKQMGSSWKDKVAPPGVSNTRMTFQYFLPSMEGDRIIVSPPSAMEVQGAEKWKDCLIWHLDIEYEKEGLTKLPIWIQRYNVPLQYWIAAGLSYLASSVGKPLYAYEMTEIAKRISYAKICVEVDVNASLPHSVFGHSECNQREEQPLVHTDDIPTKGLTTPKGKVWVVKPGGGESVPTPLEISGPVVVDGSVDDTSEGVMGLKVAEVRLDYSISVIKDSLGNAFMGSDLTSRKGVEVAQTDPDALFQALISMELQDSTKPNEGKNPRATKRGRKPKYR